MNYLKRKIKKLVFPHSYSSDAYITYLSKAGVEIGKGCIFYSPNSISIDLERPHMLHIGNYCKITDGVKILTHDYSRSVLLNLPEYGNVGESGLTYIGDNVFIGVNAIVLMGAHIGDNTIIGAGAVVSGHYPDNVVIAGNPAKVICTLDDFYQRRKAKELKAAKEYVVRFREIRGRNPRIEEMTNSFSWLYLSGCDDYEKYSSLLKSNGVSSEIYKESFMKKTNTYNSFEEFLNDCDV